VDLLLGIGFSTFLMRNIPCSTNKHQSPLLLLFSIFRYFQFAVS
jgi:hypothetical protein